jgi:hypothetical protein
MLFDRYMPIAKQSRPAAIRARARPIGSRKIEEYKKIKPSITIAKPIVESSLLAGLLLKLTAQTPSLLLLHRRLKSLSDTIARVEAMRPDLAAVVMRT